MTTAQAVQDTFTTDAAISKYQLLSLTISGRVIPANWPDQVSTSNVIGIAMEDALGSGADIQVLLFGLVQNSLWNWTPQKPVYAYYNGLLTQSIPGKSVLRIGKAVKTDKIFLDISEYMALTI